MNFDGYIDKNFKPESERIIALANEIIEDMDEQGFVLTLRQLYYQFVAKDFFPNTMRQYKNFGSLMTDARMAGRVPWDGIEDRTRETRENAHWTSPLSILESAARSFRLDRWQGQSTIVEVWIEKDALIGVIEGVCRELDVPYFACRGNPSASEMYVAAERIKDRAADDQQTVILYLGDHDPTGLDITRDVADRLDTFCQWDDAEPYVDRIALNRDQVDALDLPPNPAKISDSRAQGYIAEHGNKSWELDALQPAYIIDLIRRGVDRYVDADLMKPHVDRERRYKRELEAVAERYRKD